QPYRNVFISIGRDWHPHVYYVSRLRLVSRFTFHWFKAAQSSSRCAGRFVDFSLDETGPQKRCFARRWRGNRRRRAWWRARRPDRRGPRGTNGRSTRTLREAALRRAATVV